MKLWRSGIIWSILSFVGGLGNYVFNALIGRKLTATEYGNTLSTLTFVNLLGLPLLIVSTALIHYIAFFRGKNDEARLQGLLAGCRKFLFKATIGGSIIATVLAQPLGRFFGFQRPSLMFAALLCVLVGLWSGFAIALCQGMAWFKRLALIGVFAVSLRVLYGWLVIRKFDSAEIAVSATTFSLLGNLVLLYWWKDIFRKEAEKVSPWNREFGGFMVVTAACVGGNYFFGSGDGLVAKRYFSGDELGLYQAAATLGRAIPATVGPLLMVMFTSRSGSKEAHAVSDQRILLALYALGLACGALGLVLFRALFVKIIFGRYNDQSAAMVIPFAITMALMGLNQAIGMWSLANRWFRIAMLYGSLGLVYWITLLLVGRTPSALLHAMPIGAAIGFAVLCLAWLWNLRREQTRSV